MNFTKKELRHFIINTLEGGSKLNLKSITNLIYRAFTKENNAFEKLRVLQFLEKPSEFAVPLFPGSF